MSTLNKDSRTNRNSKASSDISTLVYGKVPPQAKDLEEAILGAVMLEKEAIDKVVEYLTPASFYVTANQHVYQAILNLHNTSRAIDLLTVIEELRTMEQLDAVGGAYYVTKLTNSVVSSANIEDHCEIVKAKYIQRQIISLSADTINEAYEDSTDAYDCLDSLSTKVMQLGDNSFKSEASHISGILAHQYSRIAQLRQREDHLTGIPTGFRELDLLTAGWQATDLIIIAARPSVGKTAFALNLARNAASHRSKRTPVLFISLEMSEGQLTQRLMSAESGIDLDKITRARLTEEEMQRLYTHGVQPLANYDIEIEDTAAMNIIQVRAKARKWIKKYRNAGSEDGLIIIDYLQLMSGVESKTVKNREQEIANVSRGLKALAKELKVPIIALSQLSRAIETAKRDPQLSDLRESGAIEQDADMVMFLTRPDYQQTDMVAETVKDMADIHVKKNRNGDLSKIPMNTVLNIQRWMSPMEYTTYKANLDAPQYGKFRKILPNELNPTGTDDNPF
jgi:replicative DNA helicase